MNALISVVIPCYNSSLTIERALKSVLKQSYSNIEIIIVDDASSDKENTLKIVNGFNDSRIIFIQHEHNKNGSAARNTGILNSNGAFVAFLDSDDEWEELHLESAYSCFVNNRETSIVFSKSVIKTANFKDIVLPEYGIDLLENVSEYLFCNNGFIQTSGLLIKKDVIKTNLFNENLIRHQDYDLILRLAGKGYRLMLVSYVGVIIHWEDNDVDKKGGTWNYSYDWAIKNKELFSENGFKCFVLKNCVLRLFILGNRFQGLKLFFKHCLKRYSLREWYKITSIFFFKKVIIKRI